MEVRNGKASGLAERLCQTIRPGIPRRLAAVAAAGLRACIDVALELFGPKGLMLGSNWPVCTVSGEFNAVINAYLDGIRTLSPEEQAEILGGTCVRCYRLGINAS